MPTLGATVHRFILNDHLMNTNSIIHIKNADLYAPEHIGLTDIIIAGGKFIAIAKDLLPNLPGVEVIDAKGRMVTPGFLDPHVHVTGGGGEGGLQNRTPEIMLSELIAVGTTGVIGVSGTDFITRSMENLLAKIRALNVEGLNTWTYTSNYRYPPTTLSQDIAHDMLLVPELLGVKIALGDHRSSFPTLQQVLALASDVRLTGLIAGKPGIVHVHLGNIPGPFDMFAEMADMGFPVYKHIFPTHCSRSRHVFDAAVEYAKNGGHIDLTTGGAFCFDDPAQAAVEAMDAGVAAENLSFSTDGHGSMPVFNDRGEMVKIGVGGVGGNLEAMRLLIERYRLAPELAFTFNTSNVAKFLGLEDQGKVAVGAIGNLCILDSDLSIASVVSKGQPMMLEHQMLIKGTFED